MAFTPDFETLLYDERDGVAFVTLNRPEALNAFNGAMQRELHALWRGLRRHDDVRCVVITGAGEKAFCTGIDRMEQMGGEGTPAPIDDDVAIGSGAQFAVLDGRTFVFLPYDDWGRTKVYEIDDEARATERFDAVGDVFKWIQVR